MVPPDPGGLAPEEFQVVKFSDRFKKNMDDHVPEIKQHPGTSFITFDAQDRKIGTFFTAFGQLINDRLGLFFIASRADNKIIDSKAIFLDIKNNDIARFFFVSQPRASNGQLT